MAGSIRSRVAPDKANKFFTEETTTPLLGKDGGTVATSVTSDERYSGMEGDDSIAKPTNVQVLKSVAALFVSAAGAAASLTCFIFEPAIMVYIAGGICLMNFPLVAYKEKKIMFLPSREKNFEKLQGTSRLLKSEAGILEEEIEYLLGHVSRFGEVEQELQAIARTQGTSIERILGLVRANEETLNLMRENLRQKIIQDVIGMMMRSEKDSSQVIDRVEAKLIALKITVKLEAYGVVFDEDKFLQAVALNPTLWGVAGTVRKLLPREEQSDDATAVSAASANDDLYDMFYMSREDQQRRGSALAAREASEGREGSMSNGQNHTSFDGRHISLARLPPPLR